MPGQPETELGKLVEDEGFGMVVMGAYGHSRIRSADHRLDHDRDDPLLARCPSS